jgi:hypothetical protein
MNDELLIACSTQCATELLPVLGDPCDASVWQGRIDEILFVPCTEEIDEAWVLDLANWTAAFAGSPKGPGRTSGKGIGDIQKSAVTAVDTGANCGVATVEGAKATWQLSFRTLLIDKSDEFLTHEFANKLQAGALSQYKLFARGCENHDIVFPIGTVSLTDYNETLPESTDDYLSISYVFQWKQKGIPTPILVQGLSAIV